MNFDEDVMTFFWLLMDVFLNFGQLIKKKPAHPQEISFITTSQDPHCLKGLNSGGSQGRPISSCLQDLVT
jgi:hypothetical protein